MINWFLKESSRFKNVKIYGFDNLDYPNNLNNYSDGNHYNPEMNSLFLKAVKNNTNRLTLENKQEYFQTMENEIKNYDISPLIQAIEKYEQEKLSKKK